MKNLAKKLIVAFAMIVMIGVAASAKSPKQVETAVFTVVPQMTCQNCENKIKSNLRFEKGVSAIETSLADQTVTIKYDPAKTDKAKLTAAFKKIGYEATEGAAAKCDKAAAAGCGEKKAGCCGKKSEGSCCGKKAEGKGCCKKEQGQASHCGGCKK